MMKNKKQLEKRTNKIQGKTFIENTKLTIDSLKITIVNKLTAQVEDQEGIGVVEVILILVVLIGLVIIFKAQLTSLVNSIFDTIVSESVGI